MDSEQIQKAKRVTRRGSASAIKFPPKVFLCLVGLLLGAGSFGAGYVAPNGARAQQQRAPEPAAVSAPADAAAFELQVLQQLDTLNRRAERMEQKGDARDAEIRGKIEKLQADVDGLKIEKLK